jgi:hypothetical protein
MTADSTPTLRVRPATSARWRDLETLFGPRGACAGCWCMCWRLTRAEFNRGKGAGNRRALKRIVASRACPGLLGYVDRQPVAWCSIAPREEFPALGRSKILAPVDDAPVWSVTCSWRALSGVGE